MPKSTRKIELKNSDSFLSTSDEVEKEISAQDNRKCTHKKFLFSILITLFGLSTIGNTAFFALLKIKYGLEPQQLNAYTFLTTFSLVLKPAYGLLTDKVYIFKNHRKPYIVICGFITSMMWLTIGFIELSINIVTMLMFTINSLMAIINSVAEALMVEDAQANYTNSIKKPAGSNVSLFFFMDGASLLIISYATGVLMDIMALRFIFAICSGICFLIFAVGLLFQEPILPKPQISLRDHFANLWAFIKRRTIHLPILFIFISTLTPSTYDALTYYYMNVLKFNFEMLGRNNLVSNVGYLLGIVLYNKFWKSKPFKSIVFVTTIIVAIFNLLQLLVIFHVNRYFGISDIYAVMSISLFGNSFSEINMLPLLTLSCMLCPKNNEAFIFETIMGIKNLSYSISYKSGGNLMAILSITSTDFTLLWLMIVISSLFPIFGLIFLIITPIKNDYTTECRILKNVTNRLHVNTMEDNIRAKKETS